MNDIAEENNLDRRNRGLERHFATIATTLILIAIVWAGNSLVGFGNSQIKMAGSLEVVRVQIKNLEKAVANATSNVYTVHDARSQALDVSRRFEYLEKRMNIIEEHHNDNDGHRTP